MSAIFYVLNADSGRHADALTYHVRCYSHSGLVKMTTNARDIRTFDDVQVL